MRPLAMMLLLSAHVHCQAQQAILAACMDRLAADPRFALLAGKLAVGSVANSTPAMVQDISLANKKERDAISEWAAARGECIRSDSQYGSPVYRPPLQGYGIDAENKVIAAAAALYGREISFGEFNLRRQSIAEEQRRKAADLSRQIQSQRTAREQADRQAREREHTQRELEEAERRTAMARQQAELAQETAARFAARAGRPGRPHRYQAAPNAPYRNCHRFGSRIICTNS